jgi:hypothetical protein
MYVLVQKRVWENEQTYQFHEILKTSLILIKHM